MRFIIYGAGAVGLALGANLFRSGRPAILIGRPDNISLINRLGLKVKTPKEVLRLPIPGLTSPDEIDFSAGDVILLTTKSHQTEAALSHLRGRAPASLPIFCCQNGVRNEETAARYFENVYGVVVLCRTIFLNPGEVTLLWAEPTGSLVVGRYPEGLDALAQEVMEALAGADFVSIPEPRVMESKWGKLLVNLANVLQAITGEEALYSPLHRALEAEATRVLRAAGVKFETSQAFNERYRRPGDRPRFSLEVDNDHGSMWQSVVRAKRTEIDYLNGEIVRLGRETGEPAPLNGMLVDMVREMEVKAERPGKYTLAQLTRMAERIAGT